MKAINQAKRKKKMIVVKVEIPDNGDCNGCPFLKLNSEFDETLCSRFSKRIFRMENAAWYEHHFKPCAECENK